MGIAEFRARYPTASQKEIIINLAGAIKDGVRNGHDLKALEKLANSLAWEIRRARDAQIARRAGIK